MRDDILKYRITEAIKGFLKRKIEDKDMWFESAVLGYENDTHITLSFHNGYKVYDIKIARRRK